jgi:hypothetical protein
MRKLRAFKHDIARTAAILEWTLKDNAAAKDERRQQPARAELAGD